MVPWSGLCDQSKTRQDLSTILTSTTLTSASFPGNPLQPNSMLWFGNNSRGCLTLTVSLRPILNLCFFVNSAALVETEARVENL